MSGGARGSDPRFGDEEIRRILQRASELQERRALAAGSDDPAGGLTLSELREVAAEAGIDPELVERAAVEVRAAGVAEPEGSWRGSPTSFRWRLVQRVPGTLPPDRLEWVLRAIRAVAGEDGSVDHVSGAMEWKKDDGSVRVAVGARAGSTRIEVTSDRSQAASGWGFWMTGGIGIFGGGMLTDALNADGLLAVMCFFVMAAVGFAGSKLVQRRWAESHEAYLSQILAAATEAAVDGTSLPPGADPE